MNNRTKELTVADVEQQMEANRANYRKEADTIENDKYLTYEGKSIKLAAVKKTADDTHSDVLTPALKKAVEAEHNTRYAMATKRPFGTTVADYRSVYTQANATPDDKALARLKQQAINTNDELLLSAIWHNAYDRGYDHLLGDADEYFQGLLDFDYSHGLRQTHDPVRKRRVLQQRFEQSTRITAPHR